MGRFKYASNQHHAFTQVHVDDEIFSIRIRGVDSTTNEIIEMYSVDVLADGKKGTSRAENIEKDSIEVV